jgi:hypothetical protein
LLNDKELAAESVAKVLAWLATMGRASVMVAIKK